MGFGGGDPRRLRTRCTSPRVWQRTARVFAAIRRRANAVVAAAAGRGRDSAFPASPTRPAMVAIGQSPRSQPRRRVLRHKQANPPVHLLLRGARHHYNVTFSTAAVYHPAEPVRNRVRRTRSKPLTGTCHTGYRRRWGFTRKDLQCATTIRSPVGRSRGLAVSGHGRVRDLIYSRGGKFSARKSPNGRVALSSGASASAR